MKRYTRKELRELVKNGDAIDVTNSCKRTDIPESYEKVGYAQGILGITGFLLKGDSGQLYAITSRTQAIHLF